jgi:hypothetical protein
MKTLVAAIVAAGLCMAVAGAQEFVAPQAPRNLPIVPAQTELRPTVDGIVADIFTVKKPWQLVNPAAPKSYGDGRKNVSYSEKEPGKPKGFILFALEW